MASELTIPVIDISDYLDPAASAEAKAAVVDQVKSACSTYGFLSISGHGVPVQTQRAIIEASKKMFALSQVDKDAMALMNNVSRRGYERIGQQTLDAKALPDHREGFIVGREIPKEQAGFLRGPNQWPNVPKEDFRTPVEEYYEHMVKLSNVLYEILVIGMGHDPSVLATFTKDPVVNLKLLHYPPHTSKNPMQFGAGAHTDFGAITILLQQPGKHGLQVYSYDTGEWIPVPALEDIFVVNIGDLVQTWTDGKYRSTLHRVINAASDDDRYSVPCFCEGDLDATNPFKPDDTTETVGEHIRKRYEQSYGPAVKA